MSILSPCPDLSVQADGAVALIRLSRPAKRNALNEAMVAGLQTLVSSLPTEIRAVVIHGEGDHFCAGLDLGEVDGEPDLAGGIRHSLGWHRAFQDIQFGRLPVISVLHGAVVGGGFELAAATHIRVAERSAFFALPEGQRGIFLGGGGSVRIPRLIGASRMMDMMLTGRTYGAEEGLAMGLSHYLVENGTGLEKGIELAKRVAANTRMTNYAVLNALPRIADVDRPGGYLMESLVSAIASGSDEAQTRLKDFLEKRAPKALHNKG